jgi:hypothetical protein
MIFYKTKPEKNQLEVVRRLQVEDNNVPTAIIVLE